MIIRNTVFILGAGASKACAYPTAGELREKICENLEDFDLREYKNNRLRFQIFGELGFSKEDILKFKKEFQSSTIYSIDAFLEHRPEFKAIGKIVIADVLIPYEKEGAFYDLNKNWYAYLFNKIKLSKLEDFCKNEISFITFNYDRSLEQYLYCALSNTYGKASSEVSKVLKNIPIIHLYGQLDDLPWQRDDGNGREYFPVYHSAKTLKQSARSIRIISDSFDINSDSSFNEAFRVLKKADTIYFFGFSYNKANLDRIRIKDFRDGRNILGTSYGLEKAEQNIVNSYFNSKIFLEENKLDIFGFLRKRVSFR